MRLSTYYARPSLVRFLRGAIPILMLLVLLIVARRRRADQATHELVERFSPDYIQLNYSNTAEAEKDYKVDRGRIINLLKRGANPNALDFEGNPIIFQVIHMEDFILKAFIEYGADVNVQGHHASQFGLDIVDGNTPLFQAVLDGDSNLSKIRILLQNQARMDIRNDAGQTIWTYAISGLNNTSFYIHPKTVDLLLSYKISPNLSTSSGNASLYYAVDGWAIDPATSTNIIGSLLQHGANPIHPNHKGKTPLQLMRQILREKESTNVYGTDPPVAVRQNIRKWGLKSILLMEQYAPKFQKQSRTQKIAPG